MIAYKSDFHKFWSLGYENLVPIVPPDAELSEHSTLFKRAAVGKNPAGKAVGIKGRDGKWRGFDWLRAPASTLADIEAWSEMDAGVGIRTGNGLVALDIDSSDRDIAELADDMAERMLGASACRIGRKPKRLLVYRTSEPVSYTRVEFTGGDGKNERIELLSDDRQFVASGIHPVTLRPYEWPTGTPAYDVLPVVTAAQIDDYFQALKRVLPAAQVVQHSQSSIDRANVDQDTLKGDTARVREAVAALPNVSDLYPTYDDYIRVGVAIKAACAAEPGLGLELYQQWAAKWPEGNDPEIVEADYARIKAPFEIGASWLYDQADKHSGGKFSSVDTWFQPIEASDNPFAQAHTASVPTVPTIEPMHIIRPKDWQGKETKEREWEVEGWIPKGEVTLLYGDGGIGKTLLAHQYATCAAAGIDWLGQPTRQARVLCFFCEDSEDELHRRQLDINASLCLDLDAIDENMRIVPRKFMDNAFAHWDRQTGALRMQAIWTMLRDASVAFQADVVIVDTIADVYAGSEIDRVQVNSFVKACLGRLAQELNGSVLALGHPSVAGKSSGSGTSGSTAWSNAARSRLYLRYPKNVDKGDVRELEGMKSNYGPKGNLLKIKWTRGAFDVLATNARDNSSSVSVGQIPFLDDLVDQAVASAVSRVSGVSLAMNDRAGNYAPKVLKRECPDLLADVALDDVASSMRRLLGVGVIKAVEIGRTPQRKILTGYALAADNLSENVFG